MDAQLVSPVGRFVQGSISLETKMDPATNKPKLGEDGLPIKELFMAVAFSKTDPNVKPLFDAMYAQIYSVARAEFPTMFDTNGACINPQFAWKIQDGDGRDTSGNSVAEKPGFAGHWILKFGSRYLPKCFHAGKYDPMQQIQNPTELIKRGYFVRVSFTVRGNGVKPGGREKPGLFLSPNLVELCAFGEEIVGGADAAKVFGGVAPAALPAGASMQPVVGAAAGPGTLAPPPAPVGALPPPGGPAAMPAPVAVAAPVAAPIAAPMPVAAPPPIAAPAPVVAAPVYQMTAAALGNSKEALNAQGWTDEALVANGYMVRTA